MQTREEIIKYLEQECEDAYFMYDEMKKTDKQRALAYMIKATTIEQILDAIKNR